MPLLYIALIVGTVTAVTGIHIGDRVGRAFASATVIGYAGALAAWYHFHGP